jgi:hypothetical protein
LEAFRESRSGIRSGQIEWRVTPADPAMGTLRFTSRYARNGDTTFEERGNEDGWTRWSPHGRASSKFPFLFLSNDAGLWEYHETSNYANLWPADYPDPDEMKPKIKDARAIGIFSSSSAFHEDFGSLAAWESPRDPVIEYETSKSDGLVIVTGAHSSGARTSWHLDPERKWAAVRVVTTQERRRNDGSVRQEEWSVDNELREFDGVWLPVRSTYTLDGEIKEVVEIAHAELNHPNDPQQLTPGDIGIEAGIQVATQGGGKSGAWSGDEILDMDEFHRRRESGLLKPGSVYQAILDKGHWESPYETETDRDRRGLSRAKMETRADLRQHVGLWEAYVKQFILQYDLNDEQQQKALLILEECQRAVAPYLQRTEGRWNELRSELKAVGRNDAKQAAALHDQMDRLREPIERIFANKLKPRLDRIPSRAQRKAANP